MMPQSWTQPPNVAVVGGGLANEIVAAFLDQKFEAGRHERRVQKIRDAEMQNER